MPSPFMQDSYGGLPLAPGDVQIPLCGCPQLNGTYVPVSDLIIWYPAWQSP